MLKAIIYHLKN